MVNTDFYFSSLSSLPLRAGPWHPTSPPLSIPSHPLHFTYSFSAFLSYSLFPPPLLSFFFPLSFSSLFPPSSLSPAHPLDHLSFLTFILLIASFRSLIIPSLGLLVLFFPTIFPSSTSLNNPFSLSTSPIQFFFLFVIVL